MNKAAQLLISAIIVLILLFILSGILRGYWWIIAKMIGE